MEPFSTSSSGALMQLDPKVFKTAAHEHLALISPVKMHLKLQIYRELFQWWKHSYGVGVWVLGFTIVQQLSYYL